MQCFCQRSQERPKDSSVAYRQSAISKELARSASHAVFLTICHGPDVPEGHDCIQDHVLQLHLTSIIKRIIMRT